MKDIIWNQPMPPCDFDIDLLGVPCGPGIYDAPTTMGPWANLCELHMKACGIAGPAFRRVKEES